MPLCDHIASPPAADPPIGGQGRVAHLAEYFGPWAIHEDAFVALVRRGGLSVRDLNAQSAAGGSADLKSAPPMGGYNLQSNDQKLAVVSLSGPMMKFDSWWGGTSTVRVRQALRSLAEDETIAGIMLVIDSPGGTVSGTKELADDVAAIAASKPLHVYIEDLGASAAYWVASQGARIAMNETGMVGSIGTFATLIDASGAAAQQGLKVHVLRAGEFKGAGTLGTEITSEQLGEMQRIVDELNEFFVAGVAKGRRMQLDAVRELADGRVHLGAAALKLGLVDAVSSFEVAVQALAETVSARRATDKRTLRRPYSSSDSERNSMSEPLTPPAAATLPELKAALPNSTPAFREAQLEAGATLDQAKQCWEIAQRDSEIAQLKADLEKSKSAKADTATAVVTAAAKRPGVAGVGTESTTTEQSSDPIEQWNELVNQSLRAGLPRHKAVALVARQNPELRQSYVAAVNAQAGRNV